MCRLSITGAKLAIFFLPAKFFDDIFLMFYDAFLLILFIAFAAHVWAFQKNVLNLQPQTKAARMVEW